MIALDLCVFSYWMNSYWGGAVAAIGGALLIGSWGRIVRAGRSGFSWISGAGAVILLLTRPYEGLLLAGPASIVLLIRTRKWQVWFPIAAVVAAGLAWQSLYDYRVTGNALRMPYQEYFSQYESIPPLIVLPVQAPRILRHFDLELLSSGWTRETNAKARSWQLPWIRAKDFYRTAKTMFGSPVWLLVLCVFAPALLKDRKMRPLVICSAALVAGGFIELIFYVHYAAPFTAVALILLVQSLRYLRVRAGAFVVVALFILATGYDLAVQGRRIYGHRTPDQMLSPNALKGPVERDLVARHPGKHVIFVRYTGTQIPHEEWITPVAPPATVWPRVVRAIDTPAAANDAAGSGPTRHTVAFWRNWALGATAAAALALVVLAVRPPQIAAPLAPPPAAQPVLVAQLVSKGVGSLTATYDPAKGAIYAVPGSGLTIPKDRAAELWLIPADGKPRSLGVVDPDKPTLVKVSDVLKPGALPAATLAITIEQPGGSPNGQPTTTPKWVGKLATI